MMIFQLCSPPVQVMHTCWQGSIRQRRNMDECCMSMLKQTFMLSILLFHWARNCLHQGVECTMGSFIGTDSCTHYCSTVLDGVCGTTYQQWIFEDGRHKC
jgi:hypothetical protein